MKKTILTAALLVCAAHAGASGKLHTVDARTLDIHGARLGMSKEETIAAITAQLPQARIAGEQAATLVIRTGNGNESIMIDFSPNLPAGRPGQSVASSILPGRRYNSETRAQLKACALEKYGEPTITRGDSSQYISNGKRVTHTSEEWQWCLAPRAEHEPGLLLLLTAVAPSSARILSQVPGAGLASGKDSGTITCNDGPLLGLGSYGLRLYDPAYSKAEERRRGTSE